MLFSLISSRSNGTLCIVGSSSTLGKCFSWKSGFWLSKILFFWYFLNFHRLVRVRSASMTNKKPLGGVRCHYFHNPRHVR